MTLWQVDFYQRPLQNQGGHNLWELLICTPDGTFRHQAFCPRPDVSTQWLCQQFLQCSDTLPERVQLFRPQSLNLVEAACQFLKIPLEATRRTPALKKWLQERAALYPTLPTYTHEAYQPTYLVQPPPLPLPDHLWGEGWCFAALNASELEQFIEYPIPILSIELDLLPSHLGLAADTKIPGIVVYGGQRSLRLARWFQEQVPYRLEFVRGDPSGVILHSGLHDRWVFLTFVNSDIVQSGEVFNQRLDTSQGLHFLLIQPDDTGVTHTGLWLLKPLKEFDFPEPGRSMV